VKVTSILRDRKYIGMIVHKGKAYPGEHEAIVPTVTFEGGRALGVDRTYAGRTCPPKPWRRRILRLTSLAPDIVEAILRGEEPEGISLRRLQKGLPVCWREQRERWRRRG
jgi:hypothetical protein